MLANLSMAEYVDWVAYFSTDWDEFYSQQSPDQMKANLQLVQAIPKKKKRK